MDAFPFGRTACLGLVWLCLVTYCVESFAAIGVGFIS